MLASFLIVLAAMTGLGALSLALYLKALKPSSWATARLLMLLSVLAHGAGLTWMLFGTHFFREPNYFLTAILFSSFTVGVFAILLFRRVALPVVILGLSTLSVLLVIPAVFTSLDQTLNFPSLWLWTHVILMILGEVCLFGAALVGGSWLIGDYHLRSKKTFQILFLRFTNLPDLERTMGWLLTLGFFMMSFGLLLGVAFAREFWTGAWWIDAKVIFALLTWIAYALVIFLRLWKETFRGRWSAWLAIVGFLLAAGLSTAVDYVSDSRHREGPSAL